jgi:hypothetical protein
MLLLPQYQLHSKPILCNCHCTNRPSRKTRDASVASCALALVTSGGLHTTTIEMREGVGPKTKGGHAVAQCGGGAAGWSDLRWGFAGGLKKESPGIPRRDHDACDGGAMIEMRHNQRRVEAKEERAFLLRWPLYVCPVSIKEKKSRVKGKPALLFWGSLCAKDASDFHFRLVPHTAPTMLVNDSRRFQYQFFCPVHPKIYSWLLAQSLPHRYRGYQASHHHHRHHHDAYPAPECPVLFPPAAATVPMEGMTGTGGDDAIALLIALTWR